MNAVTLGPLVLAGDRLAAMVAVVVFLLVTILPARRHPRLSNWSFSALVCGFLGGRLLHVAVNWQSFSAEPERIAQFWTGGFSPLGAVLGAAAATAFMLRRPRELAWAGGSMAATLLVWAVAFQLATATSALAAPTASYPRLGAEPFDFSEVEGRPVVVNLWATWCPPCRRELPMMAEMARERSDVAFVFASQGENPANVEAFLTSEGIELSNAVFDMGLDLSRHYGVSGYPTTLFLNEDGVLEHMHFGEISREVLAGRLP